MIARTSSREDEIGRRQQSQAKAERPVDCAAEPGQLAFAAAQMMVVVTPAGVLRKLFIKAHQPLCIPALN